MPETGRLTRIHDLTRPLGEGPTEEWDTPEQGFGLRYRFQYRRDWSMGSNGAQGEFLMDEHRGTHVDAPYHVIRDGETADRMDLTKLAGEAVVLDCRAWTGRAIDETVLDQVGGEVREGDIVLLCSDEPAVPAGTLPVVQTHLTVGGARWLAERRIATVGMETIGLEHVHEGIVVRDCMAEHVEIPWPAHRVCAEHGIYIIEGLSSTLVDIAGQRVWFAGLPLPIVGGTGSPIRAVAWSGA